MRFIATIVSICVAACWFSGSARAVDVETLDGLDPAHTTDAIGTSASFNGGTCGGRTGANCDRLDATFTLTVDFDAKTEGQRETIWETGGATVGWSINYEVPSTLVVRACGRGGIGIAVASFQLPPSLIDAGAAEEIGRAPH